MGDAFQYGWRKFLANLGPILLAALVYLAIMGALQLLNYGAVGDLGSTTDRTSGPGTIWSLLTAAIFGFVFVVFSAVMQAGIARGVLAITHGHRLELATMFRFENIVTVIVAGLLVGVATAIGLLLCVLPGLIVAFFSQFYVWFIVDKRLGAVDAIKASFRLVNSNIGAMVLFFLATLLAYIVGALLCGIGLLAAIPVIYIAQGYTYRRLQGEQVAA
ncbi:MAG: hypothetical protein K0Q93_590 [Nocardioidaceae bacterium]|nr:hypothetical protein [Nocardioidaceae bacterium]